MGVVARWPSWSGLSVLPEAARVALRAFQVFNQIAPGFNYFLDKRVPNAYILWVRSSRFRALQDMQSRTVVGSRSNPD
jgi:hypothetical protein